MSERNVALSWSVLTLIGVGHLAYRAWMELSFQELFLLTIFPILPGIAMSIFLLFKSLQSYWVDPFGE